MPYRLIPFAGSSADHEHHHSINSGNYGTFLRVWDALLGSAIPPDVVDKVQGVETQRRR
jgi:sterol desaturase/sphingolipid hydroxylase (fatty acid hydroxylase superfamily)